MILLLDWDAARIALFVGVLAPSVILHEVAHAYVARLRGDRTAEEQGRLTLNPIPHIDLVGTVLVPLFLAVSQVGFWFGWAKPVPVDPGRLRRPRLDMMLVTAAGPASNIAIAAFFALLYRALPMEDRLLGDVARVACLVNLFLAFFNLLPVPPLDGSKIAAGFLPEPVRTTFLGLGFWGFLILILLIHFDVLDFLFPLVLEGSRLLLGI